MITLVYPHPLKWDCLQCIPYLLLSFKANNKLCRTHSWRREATMKMLLYTLRLILSLFALNTSISMALQYSKFTQVSSDKKGKNELMVIPHVSRVRCADRCLKVQGCNAFGYLKKSTAGVCQLTALAPGASIKPQLLTSPGFKFYSSGKILMIVTLRQHL